jgi:hypothetical protein
MAGPVRSSWKRPLLIALSASQSPTRLENTIGSMRGDIATTLNIYSSGGTGIGATLNVTTSWKQYHVIHLAAFSSGLVAVGGASTFSPPEVVCAYGCEAHGSV